MTYLRELPLCSARFGRTEITEKEINGIIKNTARMILACGYREVEPEECIMCGGFTKVMFECRINTFIRFVKGKVYRRGNNGK